MSKSKKKISVIYAKYNEIDQMYDEGTSNKNDNYMLKFITHSGLELPFIISNRPTTKTEKNISGLSRLEQLGFMKNGGEIGEYSIGDFVKLKVFKREKGKTKFTKKGGGESTHQSSGFEIVAIEMSNEKKFEEEFTFFISNKYEDKIKELIREENWDYDTCIKHLKNKHLGNKNHRKDDSSL